MSCAGLAFRWLLLAMPNQIGIAFEQPIGMVGAWEDGLVCDASPLNSPFTIAWFLVADALLLCGKFSNSGWLRLWKSMLNERGWTGSDVFEW